MSQMSSPPEFEPLEPLRFSLRGMFSLMVMLCLVLAVGVRSNYIIAFLVGMGVVGVGLVSFWRGEGNKLLAGVFCLLLPVICVALYLAEEFRTRVPESEVRCQQQMRQIAMAIYAYETVYRVYPPACTTDAAGRPLHSWRTLILPYLGQQALYDQINLDLPWNDPANALVTSQRLDIYQCPEHPQAGQGNFTSYVAVTGPGTLWPQDRYVRINDAWDGISNAIFMVEIRGSSIGWAEPRDMNYESILTALENGELTGMASYHRGARAGMAHADCHLQMVDLERVNPEILRSYFLIQDGKYAYADIYRESRPDP